jgi:hypothetical protein
MGRLDVCVSLSISRGLCRSELHNDKSHTKQMSYINVRNDLSRLFDISGVFFVI